MVKRAHQAGIVIVASSGNDGKRHGIDYPALSPNRLSVGAATKIGGLRPSATAVHMWICNARNKIISSWVQEPYHEMSGIHASRLSRRRYCAAARDIGLSPSEIRTLVKRCSLPFATCTQVHHREEQSETVARSTHSTMQAAKISEAARIAAARRGLPAALRRSGWLGAQLVRQAAG